MFEKVNPSHPDKVADRIAGAIVDMAYELEENPRIAVEVLIGHGKCTIIIESSVLIDEDKINNAVVRIAKCNPKVEVIQVPQDTHLAANQKQEIRCGDNGIFKGMPVTEQQKKLTDFAKAIYNRYPYDGKFILADGRLVICQSHAPSSELKVLFPKATINPLGDWTGGIDVDSGATNRKLGSDMGDSVTGGGLCLSGDTEFLSDDYKWHKISEWKQGQKVAQWENEFLEFVTPKVYVHNPEEKLYHIYNNSKLSMCLTPYHEMLLLTSKNNLIKKQVKDVIPNLIKGIGNAGKVIHHFLWERKNVCLDYDFTDTLLQTAFCADGTILGDSNKKWRGRIRVKKQYKKERLRELLKDRDYKETQDGEYSIFWYKPMLENKSLFECFKDCSNETWAFVKNEVFRWDGDNKRRLFRTTKKEDADFIQLIIAAFGGCSTITYCKSKNCYTVHELLSTETSLRKTKTTPVRVEETFGESYCFNVPSHNLIVRHNDKIFITGNCGKDMSKADVSINIYAFLKAQKFQEPVQISCAIGDNTIDGKPYSEIVKIAKDYIDKIGGFEKFAEWGLIR